MSEFPPKHNDNTADTTDWDFLEDTSLNRVVDEQRPSDFAYYSKDGEKAWEHFHNDRSELKTSLELSLDKHQLSPVHSPNQVIDPTFSDSQLAELLGTTDQNIIQSYANNPTKIRELLASKIADRNDSERLDYYLQHPDSAVHDLVNATQQKQNRARQGKIEPQEIVDSNNATYDELLQRIHAIEQTYPELTQNQPIPKGAVPPSVQRERILAKRYLKFLAAPLGESTSGHHKTFELTSDGKIVNSSDVAKAEAIFSSLLKLQNKHQGLIREDVPAEKVRNVNAQIAEWLSEIEQVDSEEKYTEMNDKIQKYLEPGESSYNLAAQLALRNGVKNAMQKKYAEVRGKVVNAKLAELAQKIDSGQRATILRSNFASLRAKRDRLKTDLESATRNNQLAKDILKMYEDDLAKIPKPARLGKDARDLKRDIKEQQKRVDFFDRQEAEYKKQFEEADNAVGLFELVNEAKRLKKLANSSS